MILTLKWLKEFLHTDAEVEIIQETLTNIGFEVESVIDRRAELSTFVIGKILSTKSHPKVREAIIVHMYMLAIGNQFSFSEYLHGVGQDCKEFADQTIDYKKFRATPSGFNRNH